MKQALRAAVFASGVGVLALTGCSSSTNAASSSAAPTTTSTSSSSSPSSTTTSSTPTPSSTTTLPPLSPYEKEPQVIAVRKFATEYAKAVNAQKPTYAPFVATMVPGTNFSGILGTDLTKKLYYPGPLPFTPVRVQGNYVYACVWAEGFATDRKTGQAPESRSIYKTRFELKKVNSDYRVVTWGDDTSFNCASTQVVGRAW